MKIKDNAKLQQEIINTIGKNPNYKKPNLDQLQDLNRYLDNKGIKHQYRPLYDGAQILIEKPNKKLSFIIHFGSYGHEQNLIEFYDFKNEPRGYLTANQCKHIVRKELITDA